MCKQRKNIQFWVPNKNSAESNNEYNVKYPNWTYNLLIDDSSNEHIARARNVNFAGFFYTDVTVNLIQGSGETARGTKRLRSACKERRRSIINDDDFSV